MAKVAGCSVALSFAFSTALWAWQKYFLHLPFRRYIEFSRDIQGP
jgi:hypothetical protein